MTFDEVFICLTCKTRYIISDEDTRTTREHFCSNECEREWEYQNEMERLVSQQLDEEKTKQKLDEEKSDSSNFSYGPPCLILGIFLCAVVAIFGLWDPHQLETECKEWVGNNYVFDSPSCYRMIDGKASYVDVDMEKAIRDAKERQQ